MRKQPMKKPKPGKEPVIHLRFDTPELGKVYGAIVSEGDKAERNPTAQVRHVVKVWAAQQAATS